MLDAVVAVLRERAGFAWGRIALLEGGEPVARPQTDRNPDGAASFPITFRGNVVAKLQVAPEPADSAGRLFLERVALVVSAYCSQD